MTAAVVSTPPAAKAPPLTARAGPVQLASATLLVCGPLAGLGWALTRLWGHGFSWLDGALLVGGYLLSGFGVTIGFHRHLAHRSVKLCRPLRIAILIAASMSVQGSVLTWVGQHRKHHAFTEAGGDPHSPHRYGPGRWATLKGFVYSHVGWFFRANPVDSARWTPDLLADRDVMWISRTALVWSVLSLGLPFAIGWGVTGTLAGGLGAFLWGGVVRICLLHHVTFSTNSVCHLVGRRPFATADRSTNVAALAILSLGESWHNGHHAFPASARHGLRPGQIDLSAGLIALFERTGWATSVRWPDTRRVDERLADQSARRPGAQRDPGTARRAATR